MPKEMPHPIGLLCDMPMRISVKMDLEDDNPKNLLALVLLPQFEGGETEEDVTKITEVSDRLAVVD